ncbi:hypothetical protein GAY28_30770 [Azospirillum brasilense]|nr:hypothetical protein [Azospirillum brasilense]
MAALLGPALSAVAPQQVEPEPQPHQQPKENGQPKLAFTVTSFCKAHEISTPTFYRLVKAGKGPEMMQIGSETRISAESAEAWRRAREEDYRKGSGANGGAS